MSPARALAVARLSVPLALALVSVSGCAALLGMESATCSDCAPATSTGELSPVGEASADDVTADDVTADDGLRPDAGAPAPPDQPAPAAPCEAYCELMTTTCSDSALVPERPYLNRAACLAVCGHLPAGSPGDAAGNSLSCRTSLLQSPEAQNEPALVCQAAGRGGQAGLTPVCGTNCDAYCSFVDAICPERLVELGGDCAAACAQVPDRLAFDVALDRAGDTVQCRLWHVGVAAECTTEECRVRHCGHAVGIADCLPAP